MKNSFHGADRGATGSCHFLECGGKKFRLIADFIKALGKAPKITASRVVSLSLKRITAGAVIMTGAGVCTGGRVRHHLKHNLWRRESNIVFVGFAAMGSLARQIVDGVREVSIFGEAIPVHATICAINGYSAYADQRELLRWHRAVSRARLSWFTANREP